MRLNSPAGLNLLREIYILPCRLMPLPRRAGDGIIDFSHVLCLDILHRSLWLVLAQHGCLKVLGVFLKCLNMQKTIAKS